MDALSTSAASGIRARMESLEMLANNVANQATAGYKTDREFYGLFVSPLADNGGQPGELTTLPVVERIWTDFAQGTLTPTGASTDLAISGEAFFSVQGPRGILYTRNGHFQLSSDGALQTAEGYAVLDEAGQPLLLDSSLPVEVTADGSVNQDGVPVAQLGLAEFANPASLRKQAGVYFEAPAAAALPARAGRSRVHQGKLESANFTPAEAAVRLVGVMRQFEMLQKAIQLGSEMNRQAAREVAKVSP